MNTATTSTHQTITFKGNPATLVGKSVKAGDAAPEVTLVNNALEAVTISSFKGKTCVLVTVPSLDTAVCDIESKRFNKEAANFGSNTAVVIVSRDLPFAQKRWCGANDSKNIQTLSDYKTRKLGENYGVVWQETGLLARAVFIIDKAGVIRYIQIVSEITQEPNYAEVLEALKKIGS